MKIERTSLKGVVLLKPEPARDGQGEFFEDVRGWFLETYNELKYKSLGVDVNFVEDDISVSRKDVLRGIHGNNKTWKLVSCLSGKVFFVTVNCDEASPEFGRWESFDLDDANHWQVLVPPRYGSAYLALSDTAVFQYKQSTHYDPKSQFGFRWDDPRFNIRWPVERPILSARDAK